MAALQRRALLPARASLRPVQPSALARNWLKGSEGDAMHAVLCGAGHNLRLILALLRVLLLALIVLAGYAAHAVKALWHAMAAPLGVAMRMAPAVRPS